LEKKQKENTYVPRTKEEILAIRKQMMKRPMSQTKTQEIIPVKEDPKDKLMCRLIKGEKVKVSNL
jgi:hypothetical protein